ncbi:hypothetical protein STEG23_028965, partial [Scotinomys teguina]
MNLRGFGVGSDDVPSLWNFPLKTTQEQPVTLGRRGPKNNQSPLEEEDPGAASHPQRTGPSHFLRPGSNQSPSEEEDPGTASHPKRKRTQEHPDTIRTRDLPCPFIQGRNGKTSMQKDPMYAEVGTEDKQQFYENTAKFQYDSFVYTDGGGDIFSRKKLNLPSSIPSKGRALPLRNWLPWQSSTSWI